MATLHEIFQNVQKISIFSPVNPLALNEEMRISNGNFVAVPSNSSVSDVDFYYSTSFLLVAVRA